MGALGAPKSSGGLFSATTTATTTTAPGGLLFGAKTATTTTAGSFGTSTSTAPLFGAKTTTTTQSLFGTATSLSGVAPTTTTSSLGLGGTTQTAGLSATLGSGSAAAGAVSEKENLREGIVPKPIREVAIQLREKLKENRRLADEFTAASTDRTILVKEQLKDVEHKICEVYSKTSDYDVKCAQLKRRVAKDLHLGDVAQRVQDSLTKNVHFSSQTQIVQYIVDVIREYDEAVIQYQNIIEDINTKLSVVLSGKGTMTVSDLKQVLTRFDIAFSTVASKLFDATRKVQDVKSVLSADESLSMLRDAVNRRADAASQSKSYNSLRGSDFVPSQSTIAELGKQLKPALGTTSAAGGTSLFGTAGGGSLFGSTTTAAKPFSFASTSTGGTSLFPSLTTSTAGSLFSSLTSTTTTTTKPTLSFGSTITNNSSGLLFSSKK
ncbi:hypothetical protein RB195_006805 [Necator americanus]|uniref:Nucleoporin p58/p45 n=1 Tax=Necator americanus TaxID=51031 RepID=A0ABR1BUB9_NECAM